MSNRISLREFQQALSERIRQSSAQTVGTMRLAVRVGGQNWLVDLADISEVIAPPPVTPVPLTHSWFLGITNIRGRLYTVVDLPAYAGLGSALGETGHRLLLIHPRFAAQAALLVDQAQGLRNLENMQPESSAGDARWNGNAYRDEEGQLWHNTDLGSLVSHAEFLAPGRA